MSGRFGGLRNRLVNAALGVDLKGLMMGYEASLTRNEARAAVAAADLEFIHRRLFAEVLINREARDDLPGLVAGLELVRASPEYELALAAPEPLMSVRIASYRRTEELMDVAIASVLAQTYERFEIIVVNDGPNEKTRAAIAGLGDSRVRYEEFPARTVYPDDPHARWMVAGSPGMNRGADLATGEWIAPLDEDDAFTPDHLEVLLSVAQKGGAELAYGALVQRNLVNGTDDRIWSDPPSVGRFSFQGAIYLRVLNPLFRYDESSWLVEEPGDWNLARRMLAAGIRMSSTEQVVALMNQVPYTHKAPDA